MVRRQDQGRDATSDPTRDAMGLVAYGRPVVTDLGSVAELTLGSGGSTPDGVEGTFTRRSKTTL